LEEGSGSKEVEVLRIRVRGVAEAFACFAGMIPTVVDAIESSGVVIHGTLGVAAAQIYARMRYNQRDKYHQWNA
jgi:hypothetical protein